MNSGRKIFSLQVANNGLQNSSMSSNSLQFRGGSLHFPLRTVNGMNKYNDMEYRRKLHKIPLCVTFMKFSTASTGMLDETTEEEELYSSHYSEKLTGDRTGWARATYNLTEIKKKNKLGRSNGRAYASEIFVSKGQELARSKNKERNLLVLQDNGEPVSSPVIHSKSNKTEVLKNSERVGSQPIKSSSLISNDTHVKLNSNHCVDSSAKYTKNATFAKQPHIKFGRNNGNAFASNIFASNGQEQALSKNGGRNLLVLQDRGEPVPSPVIHSKSNNTKVLKDSERESSQPTDSEVNGNYCLDTSAEYATNATFARQAHITGDLKLRDRLCSIYNDILVVDNISLAKRVVGLLTNQYRHLIHACDTEV